MIVMGVYGAFGWPGNKSVGPAKSEWAGEATWCHDAGASLFIDGKHIGTNSEERYSRHKLDGDFPKETIADLLDMGGITGDQVDVVYVPAQCLPISYRLWFTGETEKLLKEYFPNARFELVGHHTCHAASAIFTSEFNEGSFVTLDGAGSLLLGYKGGSVVQVEHSTVGYFNKEKGIFRIFPSPRGVNHFGGLYYGYSQNIFNEKTGLQTHELDEKYRDTYSGKIMGLCAYGKGVTVTDDLKIWDCSTNWGYEFPYMMSGPTPNQQKYNRLTPEQKAYVLQKNFEEGVLTYMSELKKNSYLEDNVCFAGGSFMNVLCNTLLKKSGIIKNMHVPAYTTDVGLPLGAALYGVWKEEGINPEMPKNNALLGREYTDEEIQKAVLNTKEDYQYHRFDEFEELCEFIAGELNKQKIVAWFQGRSEFGPRALGSRSLLMHPGPKENKDILNERVKHREYWRPYAGIILEDDLEEYFEENFESPYMLYSMTVREEHREKIAAITHEDYSCRIQTVNDEYNKEMTMLLKKFKEASGIPAVLNTSFNDNGEPIVESPQNAVDSFERMNVDYLVIGNYVIKK